MKCTELINIDFVILNNKSPLDIYIISNVKKQTKISFIQQRGYESF